VRCSKVNTLRTREAIARFGKSALHPLCQAALRFWQIDAEFSALTKQAKQVTELVNNFKQQRREAVALARWFAKQKQKEVAQAAKLVRKIDNELLPKTQKCYEATLKLWSGCDFNHKVAAVLFEREGASYKGDNQAQKALQRTRRRWDAITNGKPLRASDARSLGILRMHRDKLIKATSAKAGAPAGYLEAVRGGDRPLSDEAWQGRLTARDIHAHLKGTEGAGVAGDKDAKEIRRDAKKLGIRLAEDQRGRKWKAPPPAKQKPKKPRGRTGPKASCDARSGPNDLSDAGPQWRKRARGLS